MASIFIVEDDEDLRLLYARALRNKGYDVIGTAIDGKDAVEKYKQLDHKPDVILLDYRMPIKNGYDAAKEILEIEKNANIILTSADRTALGMFKSIGITSVLKKPFSFIKLYECIEASLNSKHIN